MSAATMAEWEATTWARLTRALLAFSRTVEDPPLTIEHSLPKGWISKDECDDLLLRWVYSVAVHPYTNGQMIAEALKMVAAEIDHE